MRNDWIEYPNGVNMALFLTKSLVGVFWCWHNNDRKRFDVEQQKTNVEHAKEGADGTEKRASGAGRKRTLSESISKTLVPTVLPSDVGGTNGERSSSIEDLKQRLQVRACVVPIGPLHRRFFRHANAFVLPLCFFSPSYIYDVAKDQ